MTKTADGFEDLVGGFVPNKPNQMNIKIDRHDFSRRQLRSCNLKEAERIDARMERRLYAGAHRR